MSNHRLQVDLTEAENELMERLSRAAGFKTKREFVVQAMSLMHWAANELAMGNSIASIGRFDRSQIKQVEMPGLQAFAKLFDEFEKRTPKIEKPGRSNTKTRRSTVRETRHETKKGHRSRSQ